MVQDWTDYCKHCEADSQNLLQVLRSQYTDLLKSTVALNTDLLQWFQMSVATAFEAAVSSESGTTQLQLSASVQCRCEALLHALTATVDSSSSSSGTGSSSPSAADDALQRALAVSASLCTTRAAAAAAALSSTAYSSELLCTACVKLVAALAQQWLKRLPQHLPAAIQLLLACLSAETGSETGSEPESVMHSTVRTGIVSSAQLQQTAAVALLKVCTACAASLTAALPLLVATYLRLTALDSTQEVDVVARKLLLRAVCAVLQAAATESTTSNIGMQANGSSSSSSSSSDGVDMCTAAVTELMYRQLHTLQYCLEHCSAPAQGVNANNYAVCAEAVAAALTDLGTLLTLVSTLRYLCFAHVSLVSEYCLLSVSLTTC
jgi:hypothetical protein